MSYRDISLAAKKRKITVRKRKRGGRSTLSPREGEQFAIVADQAGEHAPPAVPRAGSGVEKRGIRQFPDKKKRGKEGVASEGGEKGEVASARTGASVLATVWIGEGKEGVS